MIDFFQFAGDRSFNQKVKKIHFSDLSYHPSISPINVNCQLSDFMLALLWRLTIRQSFFSTGHACSLNRLQTSAAFVATDEFSFGPAGISLFFNTFGWDIIGTIQLVLTAKRDVWNLFYFFQMLETTISCISVSIMRRHLMVWAIFAPRFVFAVIFISICMLCHLIGIGVKNKNQISSYRPTSQFLPQN